MGESYLDQLGNFLGIGVTTKERKRAKYQQLYQKLSMYVSQAEHDLTQINRMISSYSEVHVTKTKIPGIEFSASRQQVDERLQAKQKLLKNKLSEARTAKAQAKRAYEQYKHLAAEEDRKKR
ncbi:hypothetical protein [Sporolactobacillus terrae]|uniref:Flagellar FliJ protein n=1 Tax=Sporolactobacillus terrae TaxID=269673 RepID=A0A5K7X0E7_9BACL|nr:hypothetical protein [Sporolactobacillus terrae]BBO00158.1 hypothetical protein St703_28620 [Sporolactobacillus terrae]